jgi:hypothetical protein
MIRIVYRYPVFLKKGQAAMLHWTIPKSNHQGATNVSKLVTPLH